MSSGILCVACRCLGHHRPTDDDESVGLDENFRFFVSFQTQKFSSNTSAGTVNVELKKWLCVNQNSKKCDDLCSVAARMAKLATDGGAFPLSQKKMFQKAYPAEMTG